MKDEHNTKHGKKWEKNQGSAVAKPQHKTQKILREGSGKCYCKGSIQNIHAKKEKNQGTTIAKVQYKRENNEKNWGSAIAKATFFDLTERNVITCLFKHIVDVITSVKLCWTKYIYRISRQISQCTNFNLSFMVLAHISGIRRPTNYHTMDSEVLLNF